MADPRTTLDEERRETLTRLATLTGDFTAIVEASEGSNADDEHDPEGATIAFERSQLDALVQQARHHVSEIDASTRGRLQVSCRETGQIEDRRPARFEECRRDTVAA